MENALQIFNNPKFGDLHGYLDENNTAWFNAEDVARGLGFVDIHQKKDFATTGEKYETVRWARVNGYLKEFGFSQEVGKNDFLPENIVYRLAMKAKNETAEDFQAWLADDVVPSIRKTGSYSLKKIDYKVLLKDRQFVSDLVYALQSEQSENARLTEENAMLTQENAVLNQQVAELTPQANYCALVLKCKNLIPISIIAKDYGFTAIQMNKLLNELSVQHNLSGTWLLYKKFAKLGWTSTKTHIYENSKGEKISKVSTCWTQLGRLGLYHLLKENGYLPLIELNER